MAAPHSSVGTIAAPTGRRAGEKPHRGWFGALKNVSISRQFAILSALSIVMIVACLGYTLIQIRAEMMEQKRNQIQNVVEAANAIARGFVEKAKAGQMPEETAKKMALETVGAMRFAGKNYVFISTFDGVTINQNLELHGSHGSMLHPGLSQMGMMASMYRFRRSSCLRKESLLTAGFRWPNLIVIPELRRLSLPCVF